MSTTTQTATWTGGTSPFGLTWQKLLMWFFIVSDGLLFAGFLVAYGFTRQITPNWPEQSEVFSLTFIAAMTFVLISSSATMACAVRASEESRRRPVLIFLLLTALGGAVFLGMQAVEWSHLIRDGGRLSSNPWGARQFGAYFFTITGFHGTHVLSGVVLLLITAIRWAKGITQPQGVELTGLYWHFVDLVWVFIFTFFYLI